MLTQCAARSRDLFKPDVPIARKLVRFAFGIAKCFGLFWLARWISRDGLRIICYHGFALSDEYQFRSKLFIQKSLFRRRLEFLQREGYPILSLSGALAALDAH